MKLTLCVLSLALLSAAPVAAKPGHGAHRGKHEGACYFEPHDIEVVRTYYEPRQLPPGLAKKLYRTGHLPPGWAKRMEPLPPDVERRLVVLPPTYRRGYIDGSIVVYSPSTQIIVDVMRIPGR